ncbi:hypothetical protein N7465_007273 [Penicillium sp. CMV-2018d]|nr:hypothetical protein N7465_007273 [Penicillium sp. CMV-2018d]
MTSVNFLLLDEISTAEPVTEGDFKAKGCKGTVLNDETLGDFVIDHYGLLASPDGIEHKILITTTPNTLPIDEQIKALTMAGTKACVYGDKPESHRAGFSLTTLTPSLRPFQGSAYNTFGTSTTCHLDPTQKEAFTKSTTAITVGVSLIQGPPGTGKTTTAVAIVLAMMALQIRVLLTAASNKGVDNLTLALMRAS